MPGAFAVPGPAIAPRRGTGGPQNCECANKTEIIYAGCARRACAAVSHSPVAPDRGWGSRGAQPTIAESLKTIRPATEPAAPTFGRVKAGDTVVVETQDGRQARFVAQQVDGDAIVSKDGVRYTRSDIARLQRRSFSGATTALLVGGIIAAWIAVAVAAAYGELLGGGGQ